jgi:hypothetical protein
MSGQHRFAFGSALGDAGATTIASLPVDLVATQVLSPRKRKRDLAAQAGVAIPGLPFDVAVTLVEKHLGSGGASRGEQRHARRGGRDGARDCGG